MIEIKLLPTEKWKDCRDLRLEALKKEPLAFGSSYEEEYTLSDGEWRSRIKNALFAVHQDFVIGMVVLIQQSNTKTSHVANLFGLYVKPSYRGKGIGARLLEAAINKLAENGTVIKIKLAVNTKQEAAIKLYEKFGFQKVGILKKEIQYDQRFYDELLMEHLVERH